MDGRKSQMVHVLKKIRVAYTKVTEDGVRTAIDPYPFEMEPTYHRYRLNKPIIKKKLDVIGVVYGGDLFGNSSLIPSLKININF